MDDDYSKSKCEILKDRAGFRFKSIWLTPNATIESYNL